WRRYLFARRRQCLLRRLGGRADGGRCDDSGPEEARGMDARGGARCRPWVSVQLHRGAPFPVIPRVALENRADLEQFNPCGAIEFNKSYTAAPFHSTSNTGCGKAFADGKAR